MRVVDRLHHAYNRFRHYTPRLMVGLGTMLIVLAAVTLQSRGQGGWQPGFAVFAIPRSCPNCNNPGSTTGCTSPFPFQWVDGTCGVNAAFCCRTWPNYNCGTFYTCANGNPLGQCAVFNLANQEAMQNGGCP